jgi:peptidoglycan endopeptidase LytF
MLTHVKGARWGAMVAASVLMPLIAGACGDDSESVGTLPPLITTTTSTTIVVTTTTTLSFYTVQANDTLSKIATKFGVDQAALMALNGITDPDHVELGEVLQIPPPTTVAAETTTSTTTG